MAGWSGIVFWGLLVAGLVLVHRIPKLGDSDAVYKAFYSGGGVDTLTVLGLYVVPFAGIACLWHTIATRTLLQVHRPSLWTEVPHRLQLAASLIFVCLGLLPRPLVVLSYLVATGLLLSTTFHPAILLVFPAWVLMVSIVLLVHRPVPTGADHDRDHQPG